MKNVILAMLIGGILGFQACGKQKKPVIRPKIHPLLQKYFYFKPGTIWVYNIEGTNDTTVDYVNSDKGVYDICQIISQEMSLKFSFESDLGTDMCFRCYVEGFPYGHCCQVINDSFGNRPRIFNSNSDTSGIIDSVVLNGITYYNVLKSIDSGSPRFNELWFAPGVGIIKKVTHDNKVFTLRSFK